MHIVIDGRIINSSTGRYVERLVTYLQEVDKLNNYTVLVPSKDKDFWKPTAKNFQVKTADFANYSFAEQLGFKKLLDSLQPDLVHFCMPQQPVLYKGKHVTTFHDLTLLQTYNSDKNWLLFHVKQLIGRFVFKKVLQTSAEIIVPTHYVADDIKTTFGTKHDKITVTYEAAELSQQSSEPYEQPYKRFIMYVGQQSDYKNIGRLAAAHQQLLSKHPDLGLILVGSLNESAKQNKETFEKKGYRNILFTGFLPDEQLNWLYEKAEAYVFPSLMEGFGLPGLEAMAHGTPLVSSNASCLPEVYGSAAKYFNPLDITDMATSIESVITDPKLRDELVKKGNRQVRKYSWKKTAEQTFDVYKKALKD